MDSSPAARNASACCLAVPLPRVLQAPHICAHITSLLPPQPTNCQTFMRVVFVIYSDVTTSDPSATVEPLRRVLVNCVGISASNRSDLVKVRVATHFTPATGAGHALTPMLLDVCRHACKS